MAVEQFNYKSDVITTFDKVFKNEFALMGEDLKKYNDNALKSEHYRKIVFESNLFEFSSSFSYDFFTDIDAVLNSYKNLGTYESIISIVKGILGEQVGVTFEDDGKIINIQSSASIKYPMITPQNENIIDTENNRIVAINNRLELQLIAINNLIQLFLPAGIKYTINIGAVARYGR